MSTRIAQIAKQIASKMATPTDIHLYTGQTPNGIKVSILLEELNLQYKVRFHHALLVTT
jgi:glutathione S-transferase